MIAGLCSSTVFWFFDKDIILELDTLLISLFWLSSSRQITPTVCYPFAFLVAHPVGYVRMCRSSDPASVGKVNQKVAPWPGRLTTPTLP
jgi:hypothetical protein